MPSTAFKKQFHNNQNFYLFSPNNRIIHTTFCLPCTHYPPSTFYTPPSIHSPISFGLNIFLLYMWLKIHIIIKKTAIWFDYVIKPCGSNTYSLIIIIMISKNYKLKFLCLFVCKKLCWSITTFNIPILKLYRYQFQIKVEFMFIKLCHNT